MATTKTENKTLTGPELLRDVVNHILDHPETWDQRHWHCDTTHCVAGHCQIRGGRKQCDNTASSDARELLGISRLDADWLFAGDRSLSEIHGFAKYLLNPDLLDRDGFDRDGFNRYGFNRSGFDRDGFDRSGFNRDGFNRSGFNRDGFNRDGFNRDGFNRDGFNRNGSRLEKL